MICGDLLQKKKTVAGDLSVLSVLEIAVHILVPVLKNTVWMHLFTHIWTEQI